MHLLILGGSPHHPGGVEAFGDRGCDALQARTGWLIDRLPTGTAYLSVRRLPGLLRLMLQAAAYFWRQRPDCVWLQYVTLPDLMYLLLAKLLGQKVMVTPHLGSNWRSQSNPVLRSLSAWMLGFADRLALISETQALEVQFPLNVPRSKVRNFLPAALLATDLPPPVIADQVQLIHSGRLSEGKGTFLFVEVCARLAERGTPFFARITGGADASTMERLKALISERGLKDRIAVLGRVPDEELLALLRVSDVLVHLSKIDSYPLIVLEGMVCCMFPICMELAGARDMIETYDGHIVSAQTPLDETAAFLAGADLADLRQRSRIIAERVRADYSWDVCAGAAEAALRKTLASQA